MAKKQSGPKKVYLTIETSLSEDGWNVPTELKYNDDTFTISDPVRSNKLFDGAIRWRCKIDSRDMELFNLENRWWMEQ
jgi:hypothetical protein